MMQSSPPTRAWERPASRAESQYSIDLSALDLDSRSGATSPLPTQHVDRVLSEDIDGPSDFTQNMEAYMRGGTHRKDTLKRGLQAWREREEQQQHDERGLLTPRPDVSMPEEEHSPSHHTPSNSPPKESVFDDERRTEDGVDASSDWDPYAEAATPHPPPHKQLLQPTVEDYYSELTPARTTSAHLRQSLRRPTSMPDTERQSTSKSAPSTPGGPSSETMSPQRSPVVERTAPRQFSSQTDEAAFDHHIEDIREKCQRLEHLNETLSQALADERRLRIHDNAAHETQLSDAGRREKDLIEMKDQAYAHKEDFRREFGELKQRLQRHDDNEAEAHQVMERMKKDQVAETKRMKDEIERERMEHNQELRALEQDLELARRGRDDAEETARLLRAQLNSAGGDDDDAEIDQMQHSLNDHGSSRIQISELEEQVQSLTMENARLKTARKVAEGTTSNVRSELSLLRQTQEEETTRLTSDHRRAVSLAEDLQAKLTTLRMQVRDQEAAHSAQTDRIHDRADDARPASTTELQQLRSELESKQTAFNEAILERDEARDALQTELENRQSALNNAILERDAAVDTAHSLRAELEAAKLELADLEAVNMALDVRVSDAIRRREDYWRSRLDDVEKERKVMAKALMRQWGREELGPEEPLQGYAYLCSGKAVAG